MASWATRSARGDPLHPSVPTASATARCAAATCERSELSPPQLRTPTAQQAVGRPKATADAPPPVGSVWVPPRTHGGSCFLSWSRRAPYGRSPTSPRSLRTWRLVWLVPSPHVSDVTSPGSGSPSVTSLIWFPSRHLIWFPSSIKQYSILS